jgi:hypothetical protein
MSAEWDKAKAAALKILGDKGKVPDMPNNVEKGAQDMGKASGELDESREDCEAKLLALQGKKGDVARFDLPRFPGGPLLSSGATLWFSTNALGPGKLASHELAV